MKSICLSVDLEEDWGVGGRFSSHQELKELLYFLDEFDIKATFFVSTSVIGHGVSDGDITEIRDRGHEIASHGHKHIQISEISSMDLIKDLVLSKEILEEILNEEIVGYRSPYLSRHKDFTKIVRERGFLYSSSNGSVWPSFRNFINIFQYNRKRVVPIASFCGILPLSLIYIRLLRKFLKYTPFSSGSLYMHIHEFRKNQRASFLGKIFAINSGDKAYNSLRKFIELNNGLVSYITCREYYEQERL